MQICGMLLDMFPAEWASWETPGRTQDWIGLH